jgi:hypothetical protein
MGQHKRMNRSYRIQNRCEKYLVIDDSEETLGVYGNRQDANRGCEAFKKEDAMHEQAGLLVNSAIESHMALFRIGRSTARYWIQSASKNTV